MSKQGPQFQKVGGDRGLDGCGRVSGSTARARAVALGLEGAGGVEERGTAGRVP